MSAKRSLLQVVPSGSVIHFAGSTSPPKWLLCDGSGYNKNDYPFLFDAIGYTYGGANDTFNVPDMVDMFVRGSSSANPVGTRENDAVAGHDHDVNVTASTGNAGGHSHSATTDDAGSHSHGYFDTYMLEKGSGRNQGLPNGEEKSAGGDYTGLGDNDNDNTTFFGVNRTTDSQSAHSHGVSIDAVNDHSHSISINATTGSTGGSETRPKNIRLAYIIKI